MDATNTKINLKGLLIFLNVGSKPRPINSANIGQLVRSNRIILLQLTVESDQSHPNIDKIMTAELRSMSLEPHK